MQHQNTSHKELFCNPLLWVRVIVAVLVTLLYGLWDEASAETGHETMGFAAVGDLAEPYDLETAFQGNDATAFREDDAGFSAHHRVPDHFEGDDASDLRPRLNVMAITDALLADPDESNGNRMVPGRHVDSGANFGIVELPMVVARSLGSAAPPRQVTVYYDDRGWVVAYLSADEPAAGIWRYDPQDQPANDLEQNLLVIAINEVLTVARKDVPEIVAADHGTVGYYHWQYPELNSFLLFNHESGGGTSDPIRFVVPPTIENIRASASVLITGVPTPGQSTVTAELLVDDSAVVTVRQPDRLSAAEFALERTSEASRLYEVTITVDTGATASGAVMLVYTKPSP